MNIAPNVSHSKYETRVDEYGDEQMSPSNGQLVLHSENAVSMIGEQAPYAYKINEKRVYIKDSKFGLTIIIGSLTDPHPLSFIVRIPKGDTL